MIMITPSKDDDLDDDPAYVSHYGTASDDTMPALSHRLLLPSIKYKS